MKSLLPIVLVCLAAAGCTTLTAPAPSTLPSDLTGYFWPNQNASFNYVSGTGSSHVIQIKLGGTIVDNSSDTLSATSSGGTVTLSGLSSADLLGLDPSLSVVADTTPSSPAASPIAIRTIATLGKTLYAANDTAMYQYVTQGDSLLLVQHFATPNVRLITSRSGGPGGSIYAVELGGSHIWWSGIPLNLIPMPQAPAPISCFAPGDGGGTKHSQYWIGCGTQLYRYSGGGYAPIGTPFSNPIAAMEEAGGGDLVVGLQSGAVFLARDDDNFDSIGMVPPVTAIANGFIGTTNGVFGIEVFPTLQILPVRPGSITAMLPWPAGSGIGFFVGLANDSVISSNGSPLELAFGVPSSSPVTQFADTALKQLYALAGTQLFELHTGGWIQRAKGTVTPAKWLPGAFTLLKNDTGWLAGYVENLSPNNTRGYAYLASVVLGKQGSANVQLDSVTYYDVIAVQYTPYAGGMMETVKAPSYLIYFERGKGPIRIERTEAGVKTITRLVQ